MKKYILLFMLSFLNIKHAIALISDSDKYNFTHIHTSFSTNNSYNLLNLTNKFNSGGSKAFLTWLYLTNPESSPKTDEIINFLRENPDWPNMYIVRAKLERNIVLGGDTITGMLYFKANPPISFAAKEYYAKLLLETSETEAINYIKNIWQNDLLSPSEQYSFFKEFSRYLNQDDHYKRLQYLLGRQYIPQTQGLLPELNDGAKAELSLRTALIRLSPSAIAQYNNSPENLRQNIAVKRDLVYYYRKTNRDNLAINIIANLPKVTSNIEANLWFEHRNIMSRVAYKNNNPQIAYKIIASHDLIEGANFVDAHWYAGWLALRHLNKPQMAAEHFSQMLSKSTMPISLSRGYYWLGRSYEAMGNHANAVASYKKAGEYFYTYYGQLALDEIGNNQIQIPSDIVIHDNIRQIYRDNNLTQAVYAAYYSGYKTKAKQILLHIAKRQNINPQIYYLLAKSAQDLNFPDLKVKIAKAASAKGVFLLESGYPMLDLFNKYRGSGHEALYRALTRQESEYDQYAKSPVGASGLMQLMPTTAQQVSRKLGISYNYSALLNNPSYNISLGTKYLTDLVSGFDGSYIKAVAGYNAGPGRVREWTNSYGNLTKDKYQIIDWIETIPFAETRNYVQRNLENIQIYNARIKSTHSVKNNIVNDMMRGVGD